MLLYVIEFPVIVDCLIFLLMLFVLFVLTYVDSNGGFLIVFVLHVFGLLIVCVLFL